MIERLKEFRKKRGISQQALADAIGVSQQSINKYENHDVEPDIRTLIALARYFNTSVDYRIGYTEINHVIESVKSFELNHEEAIIIENWRRLKLKERGSILSVMENY